MGIGIVAVAVAMFCRVARNDKEGGQLPERSDEGLRKLI